MNNCIRRLLRSRDIKMSDVSTFLEMRPSTARGMINNPLTMKLYERNALAAWLRIPKNDLDEIFHENEEMLNTYLTHV